MRPLPTIHWTSPYSDPQPWLQPRRHGTSPYMDPQPMPPRHGTPLNLHRDVQICSFRSKYCTVGKRAIGILLECFLVLTFNFQNTCSLGFGSCYWDQSRLYINEDFQEHYYLIDLNIIGHCRNKSIITQSLEFGLKIILVDSK